MTCHVGDGIVICDGRSGGWRVGRVWCPWCCVKDETVRGLTVLIFGGYGGFDAICGSCGFAWACDDEWLPRMNPHDQEKREENIALVAATPDPKCWKCHDTGDVGMPGFDMPDSNPCDCGLLR